MSQGGDGQFERGERVDGTQLRVVGVLGRGGMGTVYEVEHVTLGKHFVLKVLHGALLNREDLIGRMQNEWRMLAQLEHPNIVRVTDAGHTPGGLPFYVMERLEGETLGARLRRQERLDVADIGEILLEVLAGLEAAHAAGAIHRDIKPENIFLTAGGAKILDFGIAKLKSGLARVQTKNGVAVGTPRYMAPEQAQGSAVDARTDVYAVGLVLYEALAGRSPFAKIRDPNELVMAHISEEPARLDLVKGDIAPELADLAQRWLSKDPSSRPPSAQAAGMELEALLCGLVRTVRCEEDITAPCGFGEVTVGPGADWGGRPGATLKSSGLLVEQEAEEGHSPSSSESNAQRAGALPGLDTEALARTVTLKADVMDRPAPREGQGDGVADGARVVGQQLVGLSPRAQGPTEPRPQRSQLQSVHVPPHEKAWSRVKARMRERLWRQPVLWTVCLSGVASFAVALAATWSGAASSSQGPGAEQEKRAASTSDDKVASAEGPDAQAAARADSLPVEAATRPQVQRSPSATGSAPAKGGARAGEPVPQAKVSKPGVVQDGRVPAENGASAEDAAAGAQAAAPRAATGKAPGSRAEGKASAPSTPDFPASGLW